MINLGIIDIDTSHPGSFIPILRSFKDVEVTAVLDSGDIWDEKYVKHFANEHNIPNIIMSPIIFIASKLLIAASGPGVGGISVCDVYSPPARERLRLVSE